MNDLSVILRCLKGCLDNTSRRRLSLIVPALLAMTGRVTMLGISRWTEKGGSYRSIQRFFSTRLEWSRLHWQLLRHHLIDKDDSYLLAADEVIVSKAGKQTFGLDRFFSSLYGRAIPSLCFFSISVISVKRRSSYPLLTKQIIRSAEEKAATKAKQRSARSKGSDKNKPGRPKGSKNKDKLKVPLSAHLSFVQGLLRQVLKLLGSCLRLRYLVMDGAYGYNDVLQLARQLELVLISRLKSNAALFFPYQGAQNPRGAKRKYGQRLNTGRIPSQYLKHCCVAKNLQTKVYQLTLRHKTFAQPVNVIIIKKTKLDSGAHAQVLLFSADLALPWDRLIDYYSLRFQLEISEPQCTHKYPNSYQACPSLVASFALHSS